jgi:hypothetical protein
MNHTGRVCLSFRLAFALLAAGALAACAGNETLPNPFATQAAAPAPDQAQAQAAAPPPPAPTGRRPAAAAGRQQAAPPPPEPSSQPVSATDRLMAARGHCWMKLENGRRDPDLEKRAKLVEKCVEEKLKEPQTQ